MHRPSGPAFISPCWASHPLKMLRYQQQLTFFDPDKLDGVIRFVFVNLSHEVLGGDLDKVLESMVREVERSSPGMVVVDSFRTV